MLAQLEGAVGSKNADHLQGDSSGNASAAVSNGDNWLIGGNGNDLLEGRGGNDVIVGGSIRLDTLIGKYVSASSPNDAYHSATDFTSTTDGASHRIFDDATLQGGFLSAVSTGGITYDKHFQELLKSRADKDYVLGNSDSSGNPANDSATNTAVFSGNRRDYTVTALDAAGNVIADPVVNGNAIFALKIRDNGGNGRAASDGTDVVIGVGNYQFADGNKTLANMFNHAPTGALGFTGTDNDGFAQLTISSLNVFDANNISDTNPLGTVIIPNGGRNWQTSADGVSGWTNAPTGNGSGQQSNTTHVLNQGQTGGKFIRATGAYTDHDGNAQTVTSQAWNLIVGTGSGTSFNGTAGSDAIFGLDGDDTLRGNAGDDYLNGGDGNDNMIGGAGNDTYVVNTSNDRVDERSGTNDAGGTDTVLASISYQLSTSNTSSGQYRGMIENLTLTGNGDNDGTGNALANVITGNAGRNTLDGGTAGADTLIGGRGDDTYIYRAGVSMVENLNGGTDTVQSAISFTLSANFENLTLTGSAANGTGNELRNVLTGNSANNILWGLDGNDRFVASTNDANDAYNGGNGVDTYDLSGTTAAATVNLIRGTATSTATGSDHLSFIENVTGSGGDDRITGNASANVLSSGDGSDTVYGGAGGDTLNGGADDDFLYGGAGGDRINGGLGIDILTGGAGADTFIFAAASHSPTSATADTITDFHETQLNELIDLHLIDANIANNRDQAFAFVADQQTNVTANSITWYQLGGNTFIQADVNGNTAADLVIKLTGLHTLTANDFIL